MGESTFDISADLTELGRNNVAVVSSGVKSILDIRKTLEYLVSVEYRQGCSGKFVEVQVLYNEQLSSCPEEGIDTQFAAKCFSLSRLHVKYCGLKINIQRRNRNLLFGLFPVEVRQFLTERRSTYLILDVYLLAPKRGVICVKNFITFLHSIMYFLIFQLQFLLIYRYVSICNVNYFLNLNN